MMFLLFCDKFCLDFVVLTTRLLGKVEMIYTILFITVLLILVLMFSYWHASARDLFTEANYNFCYKRSKVFL